MVDYKHYLCVLTELKCVSTHAVDSPHWANLYTSRGTWRHTPYTLHPASPSPTTGHHTQSSMWEMWQSTPQSCGVWCWRWGRSMPAVSFCKHAFSAIEHMKIHITQVNNIIFHWVNTWKMTWLYNFCTFLICFQRIISFFIHIFPKKFFLLFLLLHFITVLSLSSFHSSCQEV